MMAISSHRGSVLQFRARIGLMNNLMSTGRKRAWTTFWVSSFFLNFKGGDYLNDRKVSAKRVRSSYTLVLGGRPYKTGGYRSVKSAYDAFAAYAQLVPETHRVPFLIAVGDYVKGASDFII